MTRAEYIQLQVQGSVDTLIQYGVPQEHIKFAETPYMTIISVTSAWFNPIINEKLKALNGAIISDEYVRLVYHDYSQFVGAYGRYQLLIAAEVNAIDRRLKKALELKGREIEVEFKDQINMEV